MNNTKKTLLAVGAFALMGTVFNSCGDKECNDYTDPNCKNYDKERVEKEAKEKEILKLEKDSIPAAEKKVRAALSSISSSGFWSEFKANYQSETGDYLDTVKAAISAILSLREATGNQTLFQYPYVECENYKRLIQKLKELKIAVYGVDYAKLDAKVVKHGNGNPAKRHLQCRFTHSRICNSCVIV